ncbi:MAG: hypothetical protein P1P84_17765 [Deferrisomatales bacterium]|nr:hypothetical protein [Deferrisomatales bacterium]
MPHIRLLCVGLALALAACAGHQKELEFSYTNLRARESSLRRPVGGNSLASTYRNRRYAGVGFAAVVVEEPSVEDAGYEDRTYRTFFENLRGALLDGTARALARSERFQETLPSDAPRDAPGTALCRVEALPHVTPSANTVARDPVFGEVQPRITVVYTVSDAATGEVVLKYTAWAMSQWEYGPWAMEELVAETVGITNHFGEVLKKF